MSQKTFPEDAPFSLRILATASSKYLTPFCSMSLPTKRILKSLFVLWRLGENNFVSTPFGMYVTSFPNLRAVFSASSLSPMLLAIIAFACFHISEVRGEERTCHHFKFFGRNPGTSPPRNERTYGMLCFLLSRYATRPDGSAKKDSTTSGAKFFISFCFFNAHQTK